MQKAERGTMPRGDQVSRQWRLVKLIDRSQGITVDDSGDIYLSVQTDLKHRVGQIIEISKEDSERVAER